MTTTPEDREHKARTIEKYFQCVVEGRLDELPVTEDYSSESPQSGLVQGPRAVEYLGEIGRQIKEICIIRHIVEENSVATHFEEVMENGALPVVGLFEFEGDRIKFVRVFFDSAAPNG